MLDPRTLAPLLIAASLLVAGCSGGDDDDDSTSCAPGGTGTVDLTVTGLPAGADGTLSFNGTAVAATSGTVTVPGGEQTVTGDPVAVDGGALVRSAYAPSLPASPLCVEDGESVPFTVAYTLLPGSNQLWLSQSNAATELAGIGAAALDGSGTVSLATALDIPITSANGIAFDRAGNLWVAESSGTVKRFPAGALGTSGSVDPDVTISGLGFGIPGPVALAFDAAGNLWVGLAADAKVVRLDAADLGADGTAAPTVEIGGTGSTLDGIGDVAFDAAGNLWISSNAQVHRYDAARLAATDAGVPDRSILAEETAGGIDLSAPEGLAFDATGNLWVAYFGPNTIAQLSAADLAGTGAATVVPAIQIDLAVSALLDGLAFDEAGGLWTPLQNGAAGRLSPAQLAASGTVTPATVLDSTGLAAVKATAFYPAAAALPLYHALP